MKFQCAPRIMYIFSSSTCMISVARTPLTNRMPPHPPCCCLCFLTLLWPCISLPPASSQNDYFDNL